MTIICRSQRLYLRTFIDEDAIHFYQMNLDKAVIKYTGDVAFESVGSARDFLKRYDQYELHNMGRWAVCLKTTDEFLGWCGLKYHPQEAIVELGVRFYKQHWNQGYASESAKAALQYGFEKLKLKQIFAHAHMENLASQHVLEKLGFHFVKTGQYENMPAKIYKIDMPNIKIKKITATETYAVRQPVLRAGNPLEACRFDGDDLDTTFHLGVFVIGNLVGVATFIQQEHAQFNQKYQYRLRGMAILETEQGKGHGEALMKEGERLLKNKKTDLLWLNARIVALNFYKKRGYNISGAAFEIPSVGPHYLMYKTL